MMAFHQRLFSVLTAFFALVIGVHCLDNGLGRTPQMGWNSWNHFGCNINESVIKATADALVSTGLRDIGYNYLNVDDCWAYKRDSTTGRIEADPKTFPGGMKALADYAHSRGLKFGLYSDAGTKTCAGRPGSLGYEKIDAQMYAEWNVDYLKYDNCYDDRLEPEFRYPRMRDALNATGRPIFFSMCEWGVDSPWKWARDVGNSWRTTGDISDSWTRVMEILKNNSVLYDSAGPGGWNDPDMLEVGNGGLTVAQERSHFSLWALMKAPLLVGCDITRMSAETKEILMNQEVIAVNQDPLGVQGRRVNPNDGDRQYWYTPLVNDSVAVVFFNSNDEKSIYCYLAFTSIGWTMDTVVTARDAWLHEDIGRFTGLVTSTIPPQDVRFLILQRVSPESLSPAQRQHLDEEARARAKHTLSVDSDSKWLLKHFEK